MARRRVRRSSVISASTTQGNYAARVRFHDAPAAGPDSDQVVETFYMISPLKAPLMPTTATRFRVPPERRAGRRSTHTLCHDWKTFHARSRSGCGSNTASQYRESRRLHTWCSGGCQRARLPCTAWLIFDLRPARAPGETFPMSLHRVSGAPPQPPFGGTRNRARCSRRRAAP